MYDLYTQSPRASPSLKIMYFIFMGMTVYLVYCLCHGEDHSVFMCDVDDQNLKYVFASKDAHDVYFNPNL